MPFRQRLTISQLEKFVDSQYDDADRTFLGVASADGAAGVLVRGLYGPDLIYPTSKGFTAFSLPGQFAPWSESANRTLANSLPGTFAPWPFHSLAFSLPGLLAPWNFRSLERIGPGTFAPWNFRTQEYSLPGTFALWNFCSLLVRDINWDVSLYI